MRIVGKKFAVSLNLFLILFGSRSLTCQSDAVNLDWTVFRGITLMISGRQFLLLAKLVFMHQSAKNPEQTGQVEEFTHHDVGSFQIWAYPQTSSQGF